VNHVRLVLQSFRGRHDWKGRRRTALAASAKYLARTLLHPRGQLAWLAFLDSHPLLKATVLRHPRLWERHQHPYMRHGLSHSRRLGILHSHYRSMLERLQVDAYRAIYSGDGLTCGPFALREGAAFEVRLTACSGVECEGELRIALVDLHSGRDISHASLSIADGGQSVLVGCLQGARGAGAREVVRRFTRDSHGLRPKNLLFSIIHGIAHGMGARVFGVEGAAHPLRDRPGFVASYDDFWLENAGIPDGLGFYLLPESEPARLEISVASKNRAEFRRREALRGAVCADVARALFQRGAAAPTSEVARPAPPMQQYEPSLPEAVGY
jgi:uncharacterized protein